MDKKKKEHNQEMENMYAQFDMLMEEVREFQATIEKELPKIQKKEMERIRKKLAAGEREIKSKKITPVSYVHLIHKGAKDIIKVGNYHPLSLNSSFLMLMTNFEYLIKQILTYLILTYPELIVDKKIKISIEDIDKYKDVVSVKHFLTQTYLNTFLFQDFSEQLKTVFKFLCITKNGLKINFDLLEKANKIRNLLVHNRGIVTAEALAFLFDADEKMIGRIYVIPSKYLCQISEEILAFGFILIFSLAARINAIDFLNHNVTNILYDLLCRKSFSATAKIYSSIEHLFPVLDGQSLISSKINYCIALKHIPEGKKTLDKILANLKTGHFDSKYEAAICVLKNDKENFIKCFPSSSIKLDDWNSWPLFEEWRKDRKLFNKIKGILKQNTEKEGEKQRQELRKNFPKLRKKSAKK